jgi:hypothetical protein
MAGDVRDGLEARLMRGVVDQDVDAAQFFDASVVMARQCSGALMSPATSTACVRPPQPGAAFPLRPGLHSDRRSTRRHPRARRRWRPPGCDTCRMARGISLCCCEVSEVDRLLGSDHLSKRTARRRRERTTPSRPEAEGTDHAFASRQTPGAHCGSRRGAVRLLHRDRGCRIWLRRAALRSPAWFQRRASARLVCSNDAQHLSGCGLLLQSLAQLRRALLHVLEQPHVLDGYCRLVGKGGDEINLLVGEWAYVGAGQSEHADRHALCKSLFALAIKISFGCTRDFHAISLLSNCKRSRVRLRMPRKP